MKKIRTYGKHGKREIYVKRNFDTFDEISDDSIAVPLTSFANKIPNGWCQPAKKNPPLDILSMKICDETFSPLRPDNENDFQNTCMASTPYSSRSVYSDSQSLIDSYHGNISPMPNRSQISLLAALTPYRLTVANDTTSNKTSQSLILTQLQTPEEKVLDLCEQQYIVDICDYFKTRTPVQKIGEGLYGEVYQVVSGVENVAVKIVPVEGDAKVNGESQKRFTDMLSEIAISKELSSLNIKEESGNHATGFIKIHRTVCCKGAYPEKLLEAWKIWDVERTSENDNPEMFDDNQIYIVFETELGGTPLEDYAHVTLSKARSILHQVTAALAVGEKALKFEHRDLHWGNVLIKDSKSKLLPYSIEKENKVIETSGVEVDIIDFTLSRLEKDGCVVFCNLEEDETLFHGHGDYQFDIYRMMQQENGICWQGFHPKTNVMWIHYVTEKIIKSKLKRQNKRINDFWQRILTYESAFALLADDFFAK